MKAGPIIAIVALALAAMPAVARAAEPTAIRDMLSAVPQSAARDLAEGNHIVAIDLAAIRSAAQAQGEDEAAILARSRMSGRIYSLLSPLFTPLVAGATIEEWRERAGAFVPASTAAVEYGEWSSFVSIWTFKDTAAADAVFGTLPAEGFSPIGDGVMADGEPRGQRPTPVDRFSLWRTDRDRTTIVARDGRRLLQSRDRDAVEKAAQVAAADGLTALPVVDVLLHGMETVAAGKMDVLQAVLVPAKDGRFDPPRGASREEFERAIAEAQATSLPRYAGILVANIEAPGRSKGAMVAMAFTDCDTAAEAARRFVARWKDAPTRVEGRPMSALVPAEVATGTVAGSSILCAAVVTMTTAVSAGDDPAVNQPFQTIMQRVARRDFPPMLMVP